MRVKGMVFGKGKAPSSPPPSKPRQYAATLRPAPIAGPSHPRANYEEPDAPWYVEFDDRLFAAVRTWRREHPYERDSVLEVVMHPHDLEDLTLMEGSKVEFAASYTKPTTYRGFPLVTDPCHRQGRPTLCTRIEWSHDLW